MLPVILGDVTLSCGIYTARRAVVVQRNVLHGVSRLHEPSAYKYSSQLISFLLFFPYRFDPVHANRYGALRFHKPTWSCGLRYDGGSGEDVNVTPESSESHVVGCVINCRNMDGCVQRSRQLI